MILIMRAAAGGGEFPRGSFSAFAARNAACPVLSASYDYDQKDNLETPTPPGNSICSTEGELRFMSRGTTCNTFYLTTKLMMRPGT